MLSRIFHVANSKNDYDLVTDTNFGKTAKIYRQFIGTSHSNVCRYLIYNILQGFRIPRVRWIKDKISITHYFHEKSGFWPKKTFIQNITKPFYIALILAYRRSQPIKGDIPVVTVPWIFLLGISKSYIYRNSTFCNVKNVF